jgi:23S rRNA pseudouridine955/2504/2580 synthase
VSPSDASTTQKETGIGSAAVADDDNGIRVDRWFKRHYPALGHGTLEKLLRTGQVRLDGKRIKAGDRLSTGQIIRLPPQVQTVHSAVDGQSPYSQPHHPQRSEQDRIFAESLVIHKDSSVLVLNKPAGLATQGGSGLSQHIDGLLEYLTFGKKQRPRLVHRLDRDTSGVLIVARTVPAAAALAKSLAQRDARKLYWALTKGLPERTSGTIKAALVKEGGHGPHGRDEKMVTRDPGDETAKYALTDYAVLDRAGHEYAFVAAKPLTGRTHQIRVHLATLGTPVVGDFKYGGAAASGEGEIADKLHLHARSIDIAHPDGGRLRVAAPLPPHMAKSWNFLGFNPNETTDPFGKGGKR